MGSTWAPIDASYRAFVQDATIENFRRAAGASYFQRRIRGCTKLQKAEAASLPGRQALNPECAPLRRGRSFLYNPSITLGVLSLSEAERHFERRRAAS
jgi:hypothetical protein